MPTLPRQFVKTKGVILFLLPSADVVYDNSGSPIADAETGEIASTVAFAENLEPDSIDDAREQQRDDMEEAEKVESEARDNPEDENEKAIEKEAPHLANKEGISKAAAVEKIKDKQAEEVKLKESKTKKEEKKVDEAK